MKILSSIILLFSVGIFLFFGSASFVCADGLSGGYASLSSETICYLRIIQRGSEVTGYIEQVSSTPLGKGYDITNLNIIGNISGRSIAFQGENSLVDGNWNGSKITIAYPVNGFMEKITYSRISDANWNKILAKFIFTKQNAAKNAQSQLDYRNKIMTLQLDYNYQVQHFASAKAYIESSKQNHEYALQIQKQAMAAVEDAESQLSAVQAQLGAARKEALEAENKAKQTKNPDDELNAGSAETKVGGAEVLVYRAQTNLISVRDNTISGLAGANEKLAESIQQLAYAQRGADTCIALMTADLKQLRAMRKSSQSSTEKNEQAHFLFDRAEH